jgi:crossover junction endodeoxyribonuclease RuvC
MRILGIDPGASGAIVLLEKMEPVEWLRMPTIKEGNATRVNANHLQTFVRESRPDHIFVERVHAMPGNGSVSMFNFGHSVGVVLGVIAGLEHTTVTPQAWKKAAGLIGTDKDASRSRAIQLWPRWYDLNKKGAGQAFADAALIAAFGAQR